jgi:hypothetical protein
VKVTVLVPPEAGGAPALLLVSTPLQPPLPATVANHVANLALMAACVWPKASVWFVGQVSDTVGAAATVKVACPLLPGPQPLVTVKVTVVEPPQAEGAPVLLLVRTALQPPVKLAVASQFAKAVLTAAWVWQAGVVMFTGIVRDAPWGTVQVNVLVQVLVRPQAPVAT